MPNLCSASGVSTPRKVSQVEEQIKTIYIQNEQLGELINLLEKRLRPILKDLDQKESSVGTPEPNLVGLAGELREISFIIGAKKSKIRSILERIEL